MDEERALDRALIIRLWKLVAEMSDALAWTEWGQDDLTARAEQAELEVGIYLGEDV